MARRVVHEHLSRLQGRVRVAVRVRPSLARAATAALGSRAARAAAAVQLPYPGAVKLGAGSKQQEFEFDAVYDEKITQVGTCACEKGGKCMHTPVALRVNYFFFGSLNNREEPRVLPSTQLLKLYCI
jgi:hypothetical protein